MPIPFIGLPRYVIKQDFSDVTRSSVYSQKEQIKDTC